MKLALSRKNLWNALPRPLRAYAGRLLSAVPLRYLLGRRFRQQLEFVQQAQHWSAEQVRAYQLGELRRICQRAYQHTTFYRALYDDAGVNVRNLASLDDVQQLPVINRDTVQTHLDDMCAIPGPRRNIDFISTGGTSGKPLTFYIGANRSAIEYAYLTASWQRAGYNLNVPLAVFRGRPVPPDKTGLRHEHDPLLRHHHYSTFHMTDADMLRYVQHVRQLGPCCLHVYPWAVATLASFIRRAGVSPPTNVLAVIAESEIVYPEQRKLVEDVFGCRYFSCYGHTEKLVLAAECEHTSDYHVWPTYGYFELLDEEGNAVTTPGQRGEIVGTGFINRAVPFIRYRTGDHATYVGDHCSACGREQPIIREIRGHRTQEVLIAADGSEISWTAMNMHDDTFRNVRQFQFRQDQAGEAILRIVPAAEFGDTDRARIAARLGAKLDHRLNLTIEPVESIELTKRGKAVYVDQRTPRAAAATCASN